MTEKQTYGNGQTVEQAYDSLDRVTKKWYNGNGSQSEEYVYDASGRLGIVKNNRLNSRIEYAYDMADRQVGFRETEGTGGNSAPLWLSGRYTYESKTNRLTDIAYDMPLVGKQKE